MPTMKGGETVKQHWRGSEEQEGSTVFYNHVVIKLLIQEPLKAFII